MAARRLKLRPGGFCSIFFIFLFFIIKPGRDKAEGQRSNYYLTTLQKNEPLTTHQKIVFILDDEELPADNGSQTQRLTETLGTSFDDVILVSTAHLIRTAFSIAFYRTLILSKTSAWVCRRISPSFYCFIPRKKATENNRILGIKQHHFPAISFAQLAQEVKNYGEPNQLSHFFEDFGIQKKAESRFFTTREESLRQPQLLIMMTGHGQPCSSSHQKIARGRLPSFPTHAPFLKKDGCICGLNIKKMRKFILFCKNNLNVKEMVFSTCGGAPLSERLIYSKKRKAFRDLPFPLICRGCTDAPTFLVPFDTQKLLSKNSTLEQLLDQLSLDEGAPSPNHLALIKAPGYDRFMLYQPKNCFFVASDEFNENTTTPFVITSPAHKKLFILLGEPFIRRPLKLDPSITAWNQPTILSMLGGPAVHLFEQIDAYGLTLNNFLVSFFRLIDPEEKKLFCIKNLMIGSSELHRTSRKNRHAFINVFIKQEWGANQRTHRSILLQEAGPGRLWEGKIITKKKQPVLHTHIAWQLVPQPQQKSVIKNYEASKDALIKHLIEHHTLNEQQ